MKKPAPYGTWESSITPEMVAGKSAKISDCIINDGRVFWSQTIAEEKGRSAIMMYDGQQTQRVLPRPLSAKSKVHEYGGAAFTVSGDRLYFVLAEDQRVYQLDFAQPSQSPEALTPDSDEYRFADLVLDAARKQLIAVCERHHQGTVDNSIVAIPLDGSQKISTLVEGHDFFSNPRICQDAKRLAWISWDNPDMPWDTTQLWIGDLDSDGNNLSVKSPRVLAGGKEESICQPLWSPDNHLCFVSDRNDWWNIFIIAKDELDANHPVAQCVIEMDAEFATPPWVFGMANYGFISAQKILASFSQKGSWQLAEINIGERKAELLALDSPHTVFQSLHCENGKSVFIAASASCDNSIRLREGKSETAVTEAELLIDEQDISAPAAVSFPSTDGGYASALFYSPHNKDFICENEKPPLIVICHGGPTGATESSLNLKIQYWTNRGFAVADVNYRGSTGYGRKYRQSLFDKWGIYDVDDVCAVVDFLAEKNLVDENRCIIKGSSAGGYTTLAALAFRNTFSAGVSLYGIGDLEMLAKDTHKFEARYLDKLIGAYPAEAQIYRQRSPIHAVDKISCPLIIFQGLQDKVVPPNQAKEMFEAVKSRGQAVAHITYEDEAHGFRETENIVHMMEAELYFYSRIFSFPLPKGKINPITIHNLD